MMAAAAPHPLHVVVLGSVAGSVISFRGPLLCAMVERGHRVTVCAPAAPARVRAWLESMGIAYRDVPLDRTGVSPLRDLASLWALRRAFTALRPDLLFAYTIKPVIFGSIAGRFAGVPERFSMITGAGYAFTTEGLKGRAVRSVARWLYRLSLPSNRRVFFQNPDDMALFAHLGLLRSGDQAVLINGSGVDLEHYAESPLPASPGFLLLARLLQAKGVREYVEAARAVRARYPHVAFRMAGRFDSNPSAIAPSEVEAWVEEGVVEYLGRLDDVRPAIAASSVYVLPSYYGEGTPRSVLEAMAMGRPIVTTDAPGCRETVQDGVNGFLVPVRDAPALAAAMARFLEQPELISAMGRASRRIAEDRYDVHKVNAVILEVMGL